MTSRSTISAVPSGAQPDTPNAEQPALAMLGTLFPHIRQGIDHGRRPATMPLLIEAKAVADLIQLANRDQENQDEMPDGAIADAGHLLTRMLNAAILIEGGDFDGKEGGRDE